MLTACGSGGTKGGGTSQSSSSAVARSSSSLSSVSTSASQSSVANSALSQQVFGIEYDEENGTANTTETTTKKLITISNLFGSPERVQGIQGNALRTDGFSTSISTDLNLAVTTKMTVETWVALESFPSDIETIYQNLTPSAFVAQFDGSNGFALTINTFGEYFWNVNVGGKLYSVKANGLFPLRQWNHLVGVLDSPSGLLSIYLNGELKGSQSITKNGTLFKASKPLVIGKGYTDKAMGIFVVNGLNGSFDETKIYADVMSANLAKQTYQADADKVASQGDSPVLTPSSRFAKDILRPAYHAMPPANWTNEPHGLVKFNNNYHMFFQRTPNGPYKTEMHWGHMMSSDMVSWKNMKDALYPTLEAGKTSGFDMKGIWSGDVVVDNGTAYAFYTNVNHTGPFNPGISLAVSSSPDLADWEKKGPVIDSDKVDDFRDPYVWKDNGSWYMIIGSKINGIGGLAFYKSQDLMSWTYESTFSTKPYSQMDIGSEIWEMPAFIKISADKYVLVANPIGGSVGKYDIVKPTRAVYWTGTWAGGQFTPDYLQPKNLDLIRGHLAPTVVSDNNVINAIGIVDERRTAQAQLNAGWAHTFSLPREWYLLPDNKTLGQKPTRDAAKLRDLSSYQTLQNISVTGSAPTDVKGNQLELSIAFDVANLSSQYGVDLLSNSDGSEFTRIYYDAVGKRIVLDKRKSSLSPEDEDKTQLIASYDETAFGKPQKMDIFIDHSVVDVFINDAAAFSFRAYPTKATSNSVSLYTSGGTSKISKLEAWALKPMQ